MNTHRVTLSAFGTTGVLLAASLTMLAIVSALVTFDAWPTRNRGASPAEIAIQNPRAARVVRSVRNASATTDGGGAADDFGDGPAGGDGGGLPGSGAPGGGGGDADNPTADGPGGDRSPSPYVGPNPPGEGDPGDTGEPPADDPPLLDEVTTTACGAVGAAGEAVCGSEPQAYDDPYEAVPADLPESAPVDVGVLP